MKKNYLVLLPFLGLTAYGQSGKVGIHTSEPTENLSVDGTVKVKELPANGATNAIYTINSNTATNNTSSTSKDQTFTAVNTVVVDKNGVLGTVSGLPTTVLPEIKSIQYKSVTAPITNNTATASYLELGNLAVRFDGTNPSDYEATWSFRLINNIKDSNGNAATADNVIANNIKVGQGGIYGGQHRQISAQKNTWYVAQDGNAKPNVGFRDFVQSMITLVNTKEVYRLTISVSRTTTVGGEVTVASPGQVTLFLERLTDAN
ncbi:hypothetical protein [Chryseobacterium oryctis]|uniref:Uncharacterized protein n=1 Tax=Chryseobacterium oryctis TaxID=2952618 RepID=A0ABT3HPS7_9FLAO|nr:hypothetical protein [Chryseobacterium oryctis]MCW3161782.1 hypothetical protein [Chryseobacterium oryctis]